MLVSERYRPRTNYKWTRERAGTQLLAYFREYGEAPVNSNTYDARLRRLRERGEPCNYPCRGVILRYWPSMVEAWGSVGVEVKSTIGRAWTSDEEEYLRANVEKITLDAIARTLNRSVTAVSRMLKIWNINIGAVGWTPAKVENATGIPARVIRHQMDRGVIPCLRGSRHVYLDPADVLLLKDFSEDACSEALRVAIRKSLMRRAAVLIDGRDWRKENPFKKRPSVVYSGDLALRL